MDCKVDKITKEFSFYSNAGKPKEVNLKDAGFINTEYTNKMSEKPRSNIHVLIVDDRSPNILAVQSILEQFNIESDFCQNGNEAIEMVQSQF